MKKFMTLIVKEIRELITKQLVFSLVMMMALFYFIGTITRSEAKRAAGKQKISVYRPRPIRPVRTADRRSGDHEFPGDQGPGRGYRGGGERGENVRTQTS